MFGEILIIGIISTSIIVIILGIISIEEKFIRKYFLFVSLLAAIFIATSVIANARNISSMNHRKQTTFILDKKTVGHNLNIKNVTRNNSVNNLK